MATVFTATQYRTALLLGASALLSACAFAGGMTPQEDAVRQQVAVDQYMPATREMRDNIETQELFAQAAFWSHEYELNPSDLEATIKLAAAVRKLGNPSRAVEITQTSRAIHPRDPYLLAEHAAGLIADERSLDAIPVLDQGLRIAPGYGRLWSLKGAALDQMEDYDAARQHYARALEITPNDPNVLANLGLSHALSGDLITSEAWLRRAASIPGAGAGVRQNLALVLQLQGRTEDAEREMRRAQLSRGERRLPPEPVPALTPRDTQSAMGGSRTYQAPTARQPAFQRPQAPAQTYQADPGFDGRANSGRTYQQLSPQAQTYQAPPQTYQAPPMSQPSMPMQMAPNQMTSGQPAFQSPAPSARLNTTTPDGRPFTSAADAARGSARRRGETGAQTQSAPMGTSSGRPDYNAPITSEQQSVLSSIRRSLQPGPVGPQFSGQTQAQMAAAPAQTGPQPHVVGPALRSSPGQMQPQYNAAPTPNGNMAPPPVAPSQIPPPSTRTLDSSGLAGGTPSQGREPARRRR